MNEFLVTYEINVMANNIKEAALEVENILKNPTFRPCFTVIEDGGEGTAHTVDLEEEEE